MRQGRFEFRIGRRDRRAGFLPRVLGTAQTDRNLQRAFEEALHDQTAACGTRPSDTQSAPSAAARTDSTCSSGSGARVMRAARWTRAAMAAILGDVRGDRRQFRHLMPARLADGMARVQAVLAMATRVRHEIDDGVHALDGHQRPMMSRMPRLTAGAGVDSSRDDLAPVVDRRGHRTTAASMWWSSSAAAARAAAPDRQSASLAPRAVGEVVRSPRAAVRSPAPRDHACRALARHVATASCALAPSTRAYEIATKIQGKNRAKCQRT